MIDSGVDYMQGFMCPQETSARDLASEETSASIQCELVDSDANSKPVWKCSVELAEEF